MLLLSLYFIEEFKGYNAVILTLFLFFGHKYIYEERKDENPWVIHTKTDFIVKVLPWWLGSWKPIGLHKLYLYIADAMGFKHLPFDTVNFICVYTVVILIMVPVQVFYNTCPKQAEVIDKITDGIWYIFKSIFLNMFVKPCKIWPMRLLRYFKFLFKLQPSIDSDDYHFSTTFLIFCLLALSFAIPHIDIIIEVVGYFPEFFYLLVEEFYFKIFLQYLIPIYIRV
jgi:hypothetical protein